MNRTLKHGVGARISLLAFAAAAGFAPGAVARPDPTTDLVLTGMVRDFSANHADFCINPTVGNWVENLVKPDLVNGQPAYTGQGRRVVRPAHDGSGNTVSNSILGQTVSSTFAGLRLVNPISTTNSPTIDTYDPALGPYGGSNIGPAPQAQTGQQMQSVTVPTMSNYVQEYLRDGNAASTLSSSFRCSKFLIRNYHKLTIQGDVTIVVEEEFKIENHVQVKLAPGATFTVYALKDATFQNNVLVNMSPMDHTRFKFYKLGMLPVYFTNNADVCATFVCPQSQMQMGNTCDVYGTVESKSVAMQNTSGMHIADSGTCSNFSGDSPAQLGANDSGQVSSAGSFEDWYTDTPGVNMTAQARLLFHKDSTGAYEFSSDDFRPIDGKLLEEGGTSPNRNFTYEMDGEFTFQPCTGQFFEFSGDGDAFVYVDGKLVMELAGHGTNVTQYVDLERLGMEPGSTHNLQFFYASRSCNGGRFEVRTNLELRTKYNVEFQTIALLD